ncbi:hypothetical protein FISHEDRAFT_24425, partial [Fistulina hepatica ATCC 64428]
SKLDLLVRVRYANPLPAPPCPPKLINVPTNPMRYAKSQFLDAIASEVPLPLIVDAECGMPLDLSHWQGLWDGEGKDTGLNPNPHELPELHPADLALLEDPPSSVDLTNGFRNGFASGSFSPSKNVNGTPAPSAPLSNTVSWLRKTEYISRDSSGPRTAAQQEACASTSFLVKIDFSNDALLRDVERSFAANNEEFDLDSLVHPEKPGVKAIDSYEVLPDADIWPNQYDIFRFAERPGGRPADVDDPRLQCAILRPMRANDELFLAYYLCPDDEAAEKFNRLRLSVPPYQVPSGDEAIEFNFQREYETAKIEAEVPNEFLLVLDGGDAEHDRKPSAEFGRHYTPLPRRKAAYYTTIERKVMLRKRRALVRYDDNTDRWDRMWVHHSEMAEAEVHDRDEALMQVLDTAYWEKVDAAGEVDMDADAD